MKGTLNRTIREIWQKKEEDVLLEKRFVKGNGVFEDVSFWKASKIFIENQLNLENFSFFDFDLAKIEIDENDEPFLKIKLAFYYLRSVENLT